MTRIAIKLLAGLVFLLVALILTFVIVNLFDEAPSELAIEMEKAQVNTVPDANNAFLAMMGFNAPAGQDMVMQGRRIVDAWNDHVKNNGPDAGFDIKAFLNQPLELMGEVKRCSFAGKDRCWQQMTAEDREQTQQLLSDNKELAERYLILLAIPDYFNDTRLRLDMPLAMFGDVMKTGRLLRDQAMQKAKSGKTDELLIFVENNLRFWRMIFSKHNLLIEDMIAIASIRLDIFAISELLSAPEFDVIAHAERMRSILEPLSVRESSLAPTIQKEFAFNTASIRMLNANDLFDMFNEGGDTIKNDGRPWWLSGVLLLHRQAIINRYVEYYVSLQKQASLSAVDFIQQRDILKQEAAVFSEKYDVSKTLGFSWFYDYYGKLITSKGVPDFEPYIVRVHDTAAHLQLVRAQLEIRLAGLSAAEVPTFLAKHPELFNPYTREPFTWDGEARTLSFVTQADTVVIRKGEWLRVSLP